MIRIEDYPYGFEEDGRLRSAFMRELTLHVLNHPAPAKVDGSKSAVRVPRTLIRYWHDPHEVPDDVVTCLTSWDRLRSEGFQFRMFSDTSAATYIGERFGPRHLKAFARCRHPAMRCDYLRLCFVFAEGGLYVDADDVLLGDGWKTLFADDALKLQPLCYDIASAAMIPASKIWQGHLSTADRIFYVNNDPLAAPSGHPVLQRALERATDKLLGDDARPEIQSTTGPGNLTAALVAHARELVLADQPLDFILLKDWDAISETRWDLSYRGDARNWRNMDAFDSQH
jgi:mannosyltransferase OCH1-like enzyme